MKLLFITGCTILLLSPSFGQTERSLLRDGNRSYNNTKYADAEVDYRKALEKNKDSRTGIFNLGDALYKQGRYTEAAQQYAMTASRTSDKDIKAQAYHNLGNTFMKVQDYAKGLEAYKEALKTRPDDPDTKYNYEYAREMLRQQQQQQQQKNDKQDKNKDKQKQQDQQNKQDQNKNQQNKNQQNKDDQAQNQQQKDQQKAQQDKTQTAAKRQQISKEDAERILQALNNEEKDVQKKLHKKVPVQVKNDKDW